VGELKIQRPVVSDWQAADKMTWARSIRTRYADAMSESVVSKLCALAMLVAVLAFAAVRSFDAQATKPDALTSAPSAVLVPVQSTNPKDLGVGKLLVASRTLVDPDFAETVILLVRSDADGVVGLVLNRRTSIPLSQALQQLEAAKDRSDTVYLGGPVGTPAVFALLRSTAKLDEAEQVFSGVYWIASKNSFEKAISGRPDPDIFHVYVGYAGWSTDQLRLEIAQGSWFIFQGDAPTVFDSDPHSLWRRLIQKTELTLAMASS
jgi:putative transcriptional regulator